MVRVGFKDSVGVHKWTKMSLERVWCPWNLSAFGTHGLLRPAPLATNC